MELFELLGTVVADANSFDQALLVAVCNAFLQRSVLKGGCIQNTNEVESIEPPTINSSSLHVSMPSSVLR
jgi:hypothetical protein